MKFYVRYELHSYDGEAEKVFDQESDMLAFINENAAKHPEMWFDVIRGTRLEFEPKERVTAYAIKRPT